MAGPREDGPSRPAAADRGSGSFTTTSPALLEALGVTKAYRTGIWPRRRSVHVLRGADIGIGPGQVVGLVGENGSGKSTLMKILVGALRSDGGTVRRSGGFGYCPQEPILYSRLTCDEHFELFGSAYAMPASAVDRARAEMYAALGFERYARIRAGRLSGGTRAKLNLALALMHDPLLLLLDEPYAGFDWDTYLRFWSLVGARRQRGRSILIISHFVADEERFDRIVELRDGRTVPR
jgi:ABC-type multidrug transport system ATPase subunit